MKRRYLSLVLITTTIGLLTSCSKDNDNSIPVIPPSDGMEVTLNGGTGGASAVNTVFLDLSTGNQDSVKRASWDLKFYDGDQFRVKINNTNGASAIRIDETDLNKVNLETLADPTVLELKLGEVGSLSFVDNPVSYGVAETVISEVAIEESANKVYIINTVGGSHSVKFDKADLWKIRVLRKGSGYTLQYAKIADASFKTLDITKDPNYNWQFVSLATGSKVNVEPAKANWDIQWSWSIYYFPVDGQNTVYSFSDLVFINTLGGVRAAEVLTSTVSYDAYATANIATTEFSAAYDVIGSKWRVSSPGGDPIGVRADRFYVIKDSGGNVYKLKFISFHANDGGERGKPKLEYKLVK